MASTDFFEDLEEESTVARPKRPLWALNLDSPANERELVKWLNGEVNFLMQESQDRLQLIRRNLHLYRGIQFESQNTRRDIRDRSNDRSRLVQKIVVNHLYDLTENRISRLVKFKPAVAVLPTNEEFEDIAAARSTKALLGHIQYQRKFQSVITPDVAKKMAVMGEAYLWITWDPSLGDRHPDSRDGEELSLLGDDGKPEKDDSGNVIKIDRPVMVGDVCYEVVMPTEVFLDRKNTFADVNYCFRKKIMPVEEARLRWPDKAKDIKASEYAQVFDFEDLEMRGIENHAVIWEFYHKRTPQLDNGRRIVFTADAILANGPNPYSHGDLPFERITDIDLPGQVHGISFFETVKALTGTYNNVVNMIIRNEYLVSHPKWMMPAGACELSSLANDITIVQYKGQVPPALVQANPTPPELFNMLDKLKEEFQQISGVFQVSRGEVPPGIKSGVALQFLHEQEAERANLSVLKWNEFIRNTAIKTIAVAGDFYESDDERMIRVLGKNNKWMTRFFDSANLSKSYDIRVQNSSALPETKSARIQTIIDLSQNFPDLFTKEQLLDMIDLGQADKFMSAATAAVRSAEAENEMILYEDEAHLPVEFEDHMNHWKVHVRVMQEYHFKEQVPRKTQEKLINHVKVHEYFLAEQAKKNPALAEKLLALDMFPIFYEMQPSMEEQAALQQEGLPPQEAGEFQAPGEAPVSQEIQGEDSLTDVQEGLPPVEAAGQGPLPEPGPVQ